MQNNYLVFDNIVELNKDEDLKPNSHLEFQLPLDKFPTKYIGNHRVLWSRNRKILYTIGPHWPFFLFMYGILALGGLATIIYVAPKYNITMRFLTVFITVFELFIYLLTALKNPGILLGNRIQKDEDLEATSKKRCPRCGATQNSLSYHCIDCDVCIEGYDHHCVWTGKCIGKGNLAYFHVFLIWTALYLCFCIFLSVFGIKDIK